MRSLGILVALLWLPSLAHAQIVPGPPRVLGTAVVRGRITAADTGRPLRRALVTVASLDRNDRRTISTNAQGQYEIGELPAGRYNVTAWRNGYLQLSYGQRRPLELGQPLQIADKQAVERLDFTLPRMGAIGGRITDENDEPISGARVMVMRSAYVAGQHRLGVVDHTSTDDAGQYRIVNLPPGPYYVFATLRQTWAIIEGGAERTVGYSPTYFPGTPAAQSAVAVTLGIGQVRDATNISMARGGVASISGTAVDSSGSPLVGETVRLSQEFPNAGTSAAFQFQGVLVEADGSFALKDLPPGDYKLVVQHGVRDASGAHVEEVGALPVSMNGADVRGVRIISSRGGTVTGEVTAGRGLLPEGPRAKVRIVGRPLVADGDLKVGGIDDSGQVREDGTFYLAGLFGRTRIRAELPDGWMLKSVFRDGRDITDDVVDLRSRQQMDGIQVVVSDRLTTITGTVTDDRNMPSSEATVILFPAEADRQADGARYLRALRPDQQGQFETRGLPEGGYMAVAVGYVPEGHWYDPEYLESIRRFGQAVRLNEGSAQTMTLKVVNP